MLEHTCFMASIPIKLIFNNEGSLETWAPSAWRKASGATWWRRSSSNFSLDRLHTPRNVSCAACSIIEVFVAFRGVWVFEGREHCPKSILLSNMFGGEVPVFFW